MSRPITRLGRSRGGWSTKLHLACEQGLVEDERGRIGLVRVGVSTLLFRCAPSRHNEIVMSIDRAAFFHAGLAEVLPGAEFLDVLVAVLGGLGGLAGGAVGVDSGWF
ncbi:hypothetical protein SMC26_08815 [Actinomadura fulvescens]|uniref:Uncharacterized protein n=1 Tax=Actinomadura fulvescens TaxID=46160 RepID=A0ABN3QTP0_9ACTN